MTIYFTQKRFKVHLPEAGNKAQYGRNISEAMGTAKTKRE